MNSEEFTLMLSSKFSKFFQEMQTICEAYQMQSGGSKHQNMTSQPNSQNKKKRNKQPVDPNAPKKPLTGYILYFKDKKKQYSDKMPQLVITEITKLIGKDWTELDKEKQLPYLQAAEKEKEKYLIELKEYQRLNPDIKVQFPGQNSRSKSSSNNNNSIVKQENLAGEKKVSIIDTSSDDNNSNLSRDSSDEKAANKKNKKSSSNKKTIRLEQESESDVNSEESIVKNKKRKRVMIDSDESEDEDSFDEKPIKKHHKN